MKFLLVLLAASLLPAARGAPEDERFLILGKDGEIVAGPVASKDLPKLLHDGQTLAWTSLQESWHEDFHEILACRSAGEWNLTATAEFVQAACGVNKAGFVVTDLPIKSGIALLLGRGEDGQPKPTGIFRCFLATNPSGLFEKIPQGDYLVVLFGHEGYGGAKEVTVSKLWSKFDWRTLKDAKPGKKELLPVIRRRVVKDGKLEGGPLLDPESI